MVALILAFQSSPLFAASPAGPTATPAESPIPAAQAQAAAAPAAGPPKWLLARLGKTDDDSPLRGIYRVVFSPDGKLLATRGADQIVRVWNIAGGQQMYAIDGHQDRVLGLVFSPDGRLLVTSSPGVDESVRLWDTATGKAMRNLGRGGSHVEFLPDGQTLLVAGPDQLARYNIATGQQLNAQAQRRAPLSVSRDGRLLVVLRGNPLHDSGLGIIDVASGQPKYLLDGPRDTPLAIEFAPDGLCLAAGARRDNSVYLWDLRSSTFQQGVAATGVQMAQVSRLSGHTGPVQALAFSPDGRHLASASWDKTVRLWEVATRRPIAVLDGHREHVCALDFSRDGQRLASGASGQTDNTAIVWDFAGAIFAPSLSADKVNHAALAGLWDQLGVEDPAVAYPALGSLRSAPHSAVPYLVDQLRGVVQAVGQEAIVELIRKLDDDDFSVREAAQKRLGELRSVADALLRKAAKETDSAEVRHRIEKILEKPVARSALGDLDRRRIRRTVLLLETIGSQPARELLSAIATSPSDMDLAREASASLERLSALPK